jgi:hypothetical protein
MQKCRNRRGEETAKVAKAEPEFTIKTPRHKAATDKSEVRNQKPECRWRNCGSPLLTADW